MRRFSSLALGSVAVVAFSGAVQAFRQVGSFGALTHTTYGTLLIWKTVGVVAVVVVASVSRHATLGKLIGRIDGDMAPVDRPRLRRAVIIEALLAVAILAVTSLLMAANPTRTDGPNPFSATLVSNDYLASVVVSPGRVGSNVLHIYISSPGSSLDVSDSVAVRISDPSRAVDPINIAVARAGAGHHTTNDALSRTQPTGNCRSARSIASSTRCSGRPPSTFVRTSMPRRRLTRCRRLQVRRRQPQRARWRAGAGSPRPRGSRCAPRPACRGLPRCRRR